MAIDILGDTDSNEFAAAKNLASRLDGLIREQDNLTIVVGAQCYGQRRQDVDLLLLGQMARGYVIPAEMLPPPMRDRPCYLSNFALTIEVKDHSPERIRIHSANQVDVHYANRGWTNASIQAEGQKYSVVRFLERQGLVPPKVVASIWLRNWPRNRLPACDHNIIPSDAAGTDLLRILILASQGWLDRQLRDNDRRYFTIGFTKHENASTIRDAAWMFRKKIEASPLDRRKVELICKKVIDDQGYAQKLGQQLLIFRGRGGAGKTVRLLQIATDLHDRFDARVLFLTYNKALVSDVTRLFAIRGITDRLGERTIRIRSSIEFFFALLRAWDMEPTSSVDGSFPAESYSESKRRLRELLELTTPEELAAERITVDHASTFLWDYILIDEGQDWPQDERDLLYAVFGPEKIIVADGVDQFVQSQDRCDWRDVPAVSTSNSQVVRLHKSLRLKANLCRFVESFAGRMGMDWDMEVNDNVPGGRVVLLTGPYTKDVHERLMSEHLAANNSPVDALMCVTGSSGSTSLSLPGQLQTWGYQVWDGVQSTGRDAFPSTIDEYRVVKYESCRGLEGWTVACLDFDRFFDRQHAAGAARGPQSLMESSSEAADRFASRWCLIPMTRAIDTLLLQATSDSRVTRVLRDICEDSPDFVEEWK